jgi:peptidyl-tRNA hydrolase, PTH1 family
MKLIIGLGNPGKKYAHTRHNFGWQVIDSLKKQIEPEAKWQAINTCNAEISMLSALGSRLILAKPTTFMNLSGSAVQKLVNFYKINPITDLLIIHDDKDLPFGKMKKVQNSGHAGNKGVADIFSKLGTKNIQRIKCGVGHGNDQKIPTEAFVLQPFTKEEREHIPFLLSEAVKLIISVCQ